MDWSSTNPQIFELNESYELDKGGKKKCAYKINQRFIF